MKASLAWGFSSERLQGYVARSVALKLDADPQWLRLGHYHTTLLGHQVSKVQGPFFLNPAGAVDPRAELQTTIEVLFSAHEGRPAEHPQCKFMARTKWLRTKLGVVADDIIDCVDRERWKQKLGAKEAYFVFASSDLNSAASSFGHTFLRLHNPQNVGNLDLIDYGINFAAETREDDGILFSLKGLFGLYPGTFSMMPYHQKLRDYINVEGRDIWEYKTSLSNEQVEMMIDHLIELEGSYVPYFFLDDNCSYAMLELIEVVRPDLSLTTRFVDATIPIDTLKVLADQKDFLTTERRRPSLRADFQKLYERLHSEQKGRLVELLDVTQNDSTPKLTGERDPEVLESAMSYLAIQENRGGQSNKRWKYQFSSERAALGARADAPDDQNHSPPSSPTKSHDSSALYVAFGSLDHELVSRLKIRRAFHDLVSRDDGLNPFSHVEVLSATLQYEFEPRRINIQDLQLLKIISTNAVTRLDRPLSWKTSLGTEQKFAPYFEGGLGYSFDFDVGEGGRSIWFFVGRAFESNEQAGRARLGAGFETIFVQKVNHRFRFLQGLKAISVVGEKPLLEMNTAVSFDLSERVEARFSFDRKFEQDLALVSFVF